MNHRRCNNYSYHLGKKRGNAALYNRINGLNTRKQVFDYQVLGKINRFTTSNFAKRIYDFFHF